MHNKLWLADGTAAIVGGRNLGDEYFNAKPEMNFTDLDLLGVGPIANQLSHSFDQYWNSAISRPIEDFLWRAPYPGELESARRKLQRYLRKESVKESGYIRHLFDRGDQPRLGNWLENLTWARAEAIWDAPLKVLSRGEPDPHLLLSPHLAGLFKGVQKELILVSAYFVPAKDGLNYLTGKADSGVRVRLLTNSLEATDVPAVHAGYAPYRMALLEHGVKLYELRANPDQPLSGAPGACTDRAAPACTARRWSSTGARYSSVRSTSIRARSCGTPKSGSSSTVRCWPSRSANWRWRAWRRASATRCASTAAVAGRSWSGSTNATAGPRSCATSRAACGDA